MCDMAGAFRITKDKLNCRTCKRLPSVETSLEQFTAMAKKKRG